MPKYHYNGKSYQLVEAQDLVVIRTEVSTALEDVSMGRSARQLLPNLMKVGGFPEANVNVFKCIDKDSRNVVKLRNKVRKEFSEEEKVAFAGRVLKDKATGIVVIYTENFFIKFKDEVSVERCQEIIKKHNLENKQPLSFAKNAFFLRAAAGTGRAIFQIAEDLLALEEVELCHPELIRERKNKAIFDLQWHLKKSVIEGNEINQHVHVEEAWQHTEGENTIIAVIDDGIDTDHEELKDKIVAPRDTILDTDDARPKRDKENHGTACAGVACAAGNHRASGVAPKSLLMPIRSGGLGSLAEAKAFAWAADNGADVVSCSWGPRDGNWSDPSDPLHESFFPLPDSSRLAIDYAIDTGRNGKGCVIVWAAGNGREDVFFDGYASYPKVIAVAASNDQGKRCVYSDFGQAVWCCFPSRDFQSLPFNHPSPLTAGIWTTDRIGRIGYNPGSHNFLTRFGDFDGHYTATFGGTSSSCPGVAGVVALMLSANPNLTWEEIKEIIKDSCDVIDETLGNYDETGHSPFYGYGKINAAKAVKNAIAAESELEEFDVKGVARFNKIDIVSIQEGEITGDVVVENNRLLGLQLKTQPFHSQLNIRYKVAISKLGETEWGSNGTWVGTTDRRRKLIGLVIELEGNLAAEYNVVYKTFFHGEDFPQTGKNGAICGVLEGEANAIVKIEVQIDKKDLL